MASHTSCLCRFSVGFSPTLCGCLSFPCLSLPPLLPPRIFSHPNVLPMLGACQSPPAPHPIIITHWMPYGSLYNVLHEGTSEYFYSGRTVHTWPNGDTYIVVIHFCICHNVSITLCIIEISLPSWCSGKLRLKSVNTSHPSYCQTLSWTRCRQWSLLWTLHVEWPSYTHSNQWSHVTISIARVLWWEEKFGFSIITISNCLIVCNFLCKGFMSP